MSEFVVRLRQLPCMRLIKSAVKTAFSRHLLLTNTAITVCLSGTGDIMQQKYEILVKRQKFWDPTRTMRICTTGLFIGPTCHYWYLLLDRFFPGRALGMVTKKIIVDQIIFSPVNISMFLVIMGYLEGSSKQEIKKELTREGLDLFKAECIVWPPAQYVNFYFLPLHLRVLFDNMVSLCFDCYYSYVKYRKYKPVSKCLTESNNEHSAIKSSDSYQDEEETGEDTSLQETEPEYLIRSIQHCNRAFRIVG